MLFNVNYGVLRKDLVCAKSLRTPAEALVVLRTAKLIIDSGQTKKK